LGRLRTKSATTPSACDVVGGGLVRRGSCRRAASLAVRARRLQAAASLRDDVPGAAGGATSVQTALDRIRARATATA